MGCLHINKDEELSIQRENKNFAYVSEMNTSKSSEEPSDFQSFWEGTMGGTYAGKRN
jgi:hypothetical protein